MPCRLEWVVMCAPGSLLPRPPSRPLGVCRAGCVLANEVDAVDVLADQLSQPELAGVFVFLSSRYDLGAVAKTLAKRFSCPVMGATAAGTIGPNGYQRIGMVGVSFGGPDIQFRPHLITHLSRSVEQGASLGNQLRTPLDALEPGWAAAGILLTDGLAAKEERLVSSLYQSLGNVPIVGGSAADDLRFQQTCVYYDGQFLTDAAVFIEVRTRHPIRTISLHHYAPSGRKLVVTEAIPERRIIRELDGIPAAMAYAAAIGSQRGQLDANHYSYSPMLLRVRGESLVRSIRTVNPDHSLTMYCAIEEGLVLDLAIPQSTLEAISRAFLDLRSAIGEPSVVLGFESVLRRLDFEQTGIAGEVSALLRSNRVLGMNSYGEQCNGLHVNQTFTGLGFGGRE
jgi:hypothetical protein